MLGIPTEYKIAEKSSYNLNEAKTKLYAPKIEYSNNIIKSSYQTQH